MGLFSMFGISGRTRRLYDALAAGRDDEARELIRAGVDLERRTDDGDDALLLASNFGAVGEILGGAGAAKPSASASAPAASAGTSLTAEGSKGGCALGAEAPLPLLLLPAVFLILTGKR